MKKNFIYLASAAILLASCNKNSGTITHTYNKATAQYADINEVRNTAVAAPAKNIQKAGKIYFGNAVLLIGEPNKGIHVFDNSNPSNPVNVSFIDLPYTNEFYVHGNQIYAISHYDLVKINISDLANPVVESRLDNAFGTPIKDNQGRILMGFTYEVVTEEFKLNSPEEEMLRQNNKLYYDYQDKLIPVSEVPSSFIGSGRKEKGTINKIALDNSHVYVVGGEELYTFQENGGSMSKVNEQEIGSDIETIYEEGDYLYVGTKSSMIVVNNSNPSSPTVSGRYTHEVSCDPVLPNGNIAYLTLRSVQADGCNGFVNLLEVIDITNKNNPTKIGDVTMASPYGMTMLDNHLFVGEGNNGISILDVTNASNPVKLVTYTSIKAYDVLKHPSLNDVILVTGNSGLKQYQFNPNTNTLVELSNVDLP